MLNANNERELCYIVQIDDILPIEGSDNCECAVIGGWHVMVRRNTFKKGDYAVYFEIDSKLPEKAPFEFLASKHYKIKTQKYTFGGKGNFISQGLLMALDDFDGNQKWLIDFKEKKEIPYFLTKELEVTYAAAEDNIRKNNRVDKFAKMRNRHQRLFKKNRLVQWLWKRKWGKEILFLFLGNKQDKKGFPSWVRKTDEERVQNLPYLFSEREDIEWIVTEKIDGSSTTFTYKREGKNKGFYVCSRNVCFDTPKKADKCYYSTNIYIEMAEKYNIEEKLKEIAKDLNAEYVTIQGETFGDGIQKRTYGMKNGEHDFRAFNLIVKEKGKEPVRYGSDIMKDYLEIYDIPSVPILDTHFKLPKTCDEMLEYAEGNSVLDGEPREGVVLRTPDGERSFKAVSNSFLIAYHQ